MAAASTGVAAEGFGRGNMHKQDQPARQGGVPLHDVFKPLLKKKEPPSFAEAMSDFHDKYPQSNARDSIEKVLDEVKHLHNDKFTIDHAAVIREWTKQRSTSMFSEITSRTYSRNVKHGAMDPILKLEYLFLHALAGLPSAGNVCVMRAVQANLAGEYPKKKIFTWHAPTSTSRKPEVCLDFVGKAGAPSTIFRIQLTQGLGRDISKYSQFPKEEEIVLPPGSTFQVEDSWTKDKVTTVVLTEVAHQPLLVPMSGMVEKGKSDTVLNNQNILFCGNPGTGKSTIINSLIGLDEFGQCRFKAGICLGKGMTFSMDSQQAPDGHVYLDTPGLSDMKLRQQAAKAITKAFNAGGFYRLFFVVTLEAGRFKPDDKATMNLVLDSVPALADFGLIINKVEPEVQELMDSEEDMDEFLDDLFADIGCKRTTHVYVNPLNPALTGKSNQFIPASEELRSFVFGLEPCFVQHAEEIDPLSFQDMKEKTSQAQAEVHQAKQNLRDALKQAADNKEAADQARAAEEQRKLELLEAQAREDAAKKQAKLYEVWGQLKRVCKFDVPLSGRASNDCELFWCSDGSHSVSKWHTCTLQGINSEKDGSARLDVLWDSSNREGNKDSGSGRVTNTPAHCFTFVDGYDKSWFG